MLEAFKGLSNSTTLYYNFGRRLGPTGSVIVTQKHKSGFIVHTNHLYLVHCVCGWSAGNAGSVPPPQRKEDLQLPAPQAALSGRRAESVR